MAKHKQISISIMDFLKSENKSTDIFKHLRLVNAQIKACCVLHKNLKLRMCKLFHSIHCCI